VWRGKKPPSSTVQIRRERKLSRGYEGHERTRKPQGGALAGEENPLRETVPSAMAISFWNKWEEGSGREREGL